MRWITLFILSFALISCGSGQKRNQKRNADLVVTYENQTIYSTGPSWNTYEDLLGAINSQKRPIFVVFSANWCTYCQKLRAIIKQQGWRQKIYIVNYDELWVQRLATMMNAKIVPTMMIFDGKNGEISKKVTGWVSIATELMYKFKPRERK